MEQHRGRVLSPFVGREREMTTLQALLAQVEAGRGQVVGRGRASLGLANHGSSMSFAVVWGGDG